MTHSEYVNQRDVYDQYYYECPSCGKHVAKRPNEMKDRIIQRCRHCNNVVRMKTKKRGDVEVKLSYTDCSKFIRRKLGITLFSYQEVMLKAFCEGQTVRTARGIGRSFVADAFGKYVANLVAENDYDKSPDIVFPYTCALKDGVWDEGQIELLKRDSDASWFEKEMLCK